MQILIDVVKLQKQQNLLKIKKKITATTKDDVEALKELVELLQTIVSESIDRDLPIDKAFAAVHIALMKKQPIDYSFYESVLNDYRNVAPLKHIRQASRGVSILQEIHNRYKTS